MTRENLVITMNKLCETLRTTNAAGNGNALDRIEVLDYNGETYAVPIFEDGNGTPNEHFPHGYYAVNISGDSAIAAIMDVVQNFVREMW